MTSNAGTIRRAFEIADESMFELLTSHGLLSRPVIEDRGGLIRLASREGHEVKTLADADPAIREAFCWLEPRGLASLERDAHRECIRVPSRAEFQRLSGAAQRGVPGDCHE